MMKAHPKPLRSGFVAWEPGFSLILVSFLLVCVFQIPLADETAADKDAYVRAVTRGEGFLPWQEKGISNEEMEFRRKIERMKDDLLESRTAITHPVLLGTEEIARAKKNIESQEWAKNWFNSQKTVADYIVDQSEGYIESMIPEHTMTHAYGFTCPNCVGDLSQEAAGSSLFHWDYRHPDEIRCRRCGQTYPDPEYPELAKLICPRMGEEFSYYLNEEERKHPEDRSGKYAYHWVGKPIHVSFSGIIRERKVFFMISSVKRLAIVYALTEEPQYADAAIEILCRLADCYRNWLYHDYWDSFADCDPMYAAWHDQNLPLEWKRHLCADAFNKDSLEKASMLQSYWGAGRTHPSTDSIGTLTGICLAYDLVYSAKDASGDPLWTPELRAKVERDLLLEWEMGAEPYVGGHGKATNANNKAPRIYNAQAAVAKCLGIPLLADTALRGYEVVRDKSFLYDGFSTESPAYTNMYLSQLLQVPETLYGFQWPGEFEGREGTVDLYASDTRLRLMFRSVIDQLRPDGRYLPLSDTNVMSSPSGSIIELGVKRYPEYYRGKLPQRYKKLSPSEYTLFHFDSTDTGSHGGFDPPELLYPAWMTGILRHGTGEEASVLSLSFCPPGGHRHYDNLAVFSVDSGDTVLGDHGYVGDMPVNSWIKSTYSHNLVIVDDEEQRHRGSRPRHPRFHNMFTSPKVSLIEASTDAYEQCDEYRRLIVLLKGPGSRTLAVDIFRVRGGQKHAYRVFSELASSDAPNGKLSFSNLNMPAEKPLPDIGGSLKKEDIFGFRDIRSVEDPPDHWQAIWQEAERRYRLWMLTPSDRVHAANGPGQRTLNDAGRRVRYVDAVREKPNSGSVFVAVHEPGNAEGTMAIKNVRRLDVPSGAGPDAVALAIDSEWGRYLLFSEFDKTVEVEGVRFGGYFGLLCETQNDASWMCSLGATTAQKDKFGFSGKTARWEGEVESNTGSEIRPRTRKPSDWPELPPGCRPYVTAFTGEYWTGFPVDNVEEDRIRVGRFLLPGVNRFEFKAFRYAEMPN